MSINYDEPESFLDSLDDDDRKEILEKALEKFKQCEDNEKDNRTNMLEDLEFGRMGKQWEERDSELRAREGRPMLTINRMPTFIRQIVNDARLNKPSIKCHPVDDKADPDTAEILNGIIRNIEVQSKADIAYDTAIDSAVSCGLGYFRIDVEYDNDWSFEQEIRINRIGNPFTVYGDPASTAGDTSDWNDAFITEMMPIDEFEEGYPDAEAVDFENMSNDEMRQPWFTDKNVRIAEYWTRRDVPKTIYKMSDGQIIDKDKLEDPELAQYLANNQIFPVDQREIMGKKVVQYLLNGQEILEATEWAGKFIPISAVYGDEVNIEGQRYFHSLIHFAKDSQRMYNYWRTAATELVALAPKAPWIGAAGQFASDERWADANTDSFAYLEYDMVISDEGVPAPPPMRQPFAGVPAGALSEAAHASDDIKSVLGLYDASLGARSNETSGVAIRQRKMEGDVSTFHFLDNMTRAIRHGGLIILDLIPSVYNEARIMRIMGEDETPENVQVNQEFPVMMGHNQGSKMEPGEMDPNTGQPGPEQPVMKIYDLTVGKYDITVKAGPSFSTRREEAATQMMELLRAFPNAAPIIGDILAESLDWPRADEIAKRLKTLLPPHLQQDEDGEDVNPQVIQLQQQIKQGIEMLRKSGAELEALKADKTLEHAKIQIEQTKAQVAVKKVDVDMFDAQTKRQAAEAEAAKDMAEAHLKTIQAQTEQIEAQTAQMYPDSPSPDDTPPVSSPAAAEPVVVNVYGSAAKVAEVIRDEAGNMIGAQITEVPEQ